MHDLIRGSITWKNNTLVDQVLLKSDGMPTYHLAMVVDDHLMKITHILRGEEWLPSAPIHKLLFDAFGWAMPVFVHLPVILKTDGKGKMSKRDRGAMVSEYREEGFVAEAMFNFLDQYRLEF